MLNREYWGKKYTNEANTVLMPQLRNYGVQSFTANFDPRNEASTTVLQSFRFLGKTGKVKGFLYGTVRVYSALKIQEKENEIVKENAWIQRDFVVARVRIGDSIIGFANESIETCSA